MNFDLHVKDPQFESQRRQPQGLHPTVLPVLVPGPSKSVGCVRKDVQCKVSMSN